ncbi:disulfide bond formation protein B [Candidatus Parcubacteria bacterium]|nr:disulfide bond formation protein B [Candidatus Parcubacteria bacterium]
MIIELGNKILALGTIAGQVLVVLGVVYLLFLRKKQFAVVTFIQKNALMLAFLISLASVLGSLFYSEIVGFPPCDLCWIQRIFMYPLVVVLGFATINKDRRLIKYALASSVIGALVSAYHNYMYYWNSGLDAFCQLGGTQVSCVKRYVFEFGYVTIPLMALTAFALIIMLLIFYKLGKSRENITV